MKIGNFDTDKKVFIIAELSANHSGSLKTAVDTIKAAKRAGADAIKLQTYTPDSLTLNSNLDDFIIKERILFFYFLSNKCQLFLIGNDTI